MVLRELRIRNLRLVEDVSLDLGSGWSAFVGPNGAGKSSVLEAAYLLSHGRSFRRGGRDSLTRLGSSGFSVFGRLGLADDSERRLGLARSEGRLEARVDGEVTGIAGLVAACAVVCFEPGSHELINGVAEERRRFLDWGVFHVEHEFLSCWRRYQRALRQRNTVLREGARAGSLEPWEIEMAESGSRISAMRAAYMARLRPVLDEILSGFLGELGPVVLNLQHGWKEGLSLAEALEEGRSRDLERGFTGRGPHRADWSIGFERAPRREHLSRGQEKLCALALVFAQSRLFAEQCGEAPVWCLDDLASELDQDHQARVIRLAQASGAQVLVTGTELPAGLAEAVQPLKVFHVEQGRIRR
jgi:DNA replication and repair protein RecF